MIAGRFEAPAPIGPLTLTADGDALTGVYFAPHRWPPDTTGWRADQGWFTAVCQQLAAYFARDLREFDLPLAPVGTPFQQRVWLALRTIPYGQTISYQTLANRLGEPTATRAVGAANGRNPISIIVPCHRVIGADGRLVGFGGGIERKQALLDLETPRLF
ncbi:MAG: methylated-DNA--[protein]-cysteine S-methyltransferase [Alphaproteobacteria bacterium]|nr:methylated-DNA--[protein]-cysteine S-methyltransferase [Alphaproteobacteria bacterium]TAD91036.1 MAG: methylated-DNA--[protein]-cysteine S-methyltransferase [Alphaproteobacteria bacterium]